MIALPGERRQQLTKRRLIKSSASAAVPDDDINHDDDDAHHENCEQHAPELECGWIYLDRAVIVVHVRGPRVIEGRMEGHAPH